MKKRLLFVAPSSIPTYGAEAIVNKKLLMALCNSNKFEIDLVSQNVPYRHYPIDDDVISLKSHYVIENDLSLNIKTVWEHILALFKFGITFKSAHWALRALATVEKLVQCNKYHYIVTKDSPSFILGNYIKNKYGIKWVATWNDPYPNIKYPAPYGKGPYAKGDIFDQIRIPVMQNADIHIFPSERIRKYMLKYLKVEINQTRIIPHVVMNVDYQSNINNSALKIIHSGTLQRPRNPKTFLEAFKIFKTNYPESNVCIDILGILEKEDLQFIQNNNLNKSIKFIPAVSYKESLDILSNYHIALIIEANCEEGIFLPTKVTDFIQCKKPIFSVSPQVGVLNDLYKKGAVSYFADVNDINSIYNELEHIYKDFISNKIIELKPSALCDFTEDSVVNQYYNI